MSRGPVIFGGIVLTLVVLAFVGWVYGGVEAWHDTGSVTWLSVGQKQFRDDQGIGYWWIPYSYAITTSVHGSINFTSPYNENACSFCHAGSSEPPTLHQTVGVIKHNNGNYDLVFDP